MKKSWKKILKKIWEKIWKNLEKIQKNFEKNVKIFSRILLIVNENFKNKWPFWFQQAMEKLNLDTKKMPLGKLSKAQIAKGFEALEKIETRFEIQTASHLARVISSASNLLLNNEKTNEEDQ